MSFFSYPKPTSWYGDTVIRRAPDFNLKSTIFPRKVWPFQKNFLTLHRRL